MGGFEEEVHQRIPTQVGYILIEFKSFAWWLLFILHLFVYT